MPPPSRNGQVGSSPPSSNEATFEGTPSTNVTALSPEVIGNSGRKLPKFNLKVDTNVDFLHERPILSTVLRLPPPSIGTQLSPIADEFTPRSQAANQMPGHGNVVDASSKVANNFHYIEEATGTQALVENSYAENPDSKAPKMSPHGVVGQAPAGTVLTDYKQRSHSPLSQEVRVVCNDFSVNEKVTRAFVISNVGDPSARSIAATFQTNQFPSLYKIDSTQMEHGIFQLYFHDVRDAKQAFCLAAIFTHAQAVVTSLTAKNIAACKNYDPDYVSNHEAELLVTLNVVSDKDKMVKLIEFHNVLARYGDVKAVHSIRSGDESLVFRVEYHDARDADNALENLNERVILGVVFRVARYEPDILTEPRAAVFVAPRIVAPVAPRAIYPFAPRAVTPAMSRPEVPSFTGRTTVPADSIGEMSQMMNNMMLIPAYPPPVVHTGHNQVDLARIHHGIDVRTTIMLRNIPNKVDQATLKYLLDQTSFGQYDFMYLRIDFANNCNVGYAFINFIDPIAIVSFAEARAGQKWNIFNSDKVAEISYATIQGRDCLVQKFRNSSVMLEHPSYRPKLYLTIYHQYPGQEEEFPDPDNFSKMRRSIENAEHIGLFAPKGNRTNTYAHPSFSRPAIRRRHGLFAPREGQMHRDQQRRRRSAYDRGTTGAEMEANSFGLVDSPRVHYHTRYYR